MHKMLEEVLQLKTLSQFSLTTLKNSIIILENVTLRQLFAFLTVIE